MPPASTLGVVAVALAALAVLPGTLGIVKFTRRIAATGAGARLIYGQSRWVLLASAAAMLAALIVASKADTAGVALPAMALLYAAILVFGFFMHVGLNFKPVRKPVFMSAAEALSRFGAEEEVIGVLDAGGNPYAFVTRLARRPHVIYRPGSDNPFLVTHCILAHSSMSYAMDGDFARPDIQVVAVIANNMVFYDRSSRCAVIQIENRPRHGSLALAPLNTVAVRLGTWQALYPDSPVWVRQKDWRDTFYLKLLARADVIDPASPAMIYPTEHAVDTRLPMKSQVLGVEVDGESRAYPVPLAAQLEVINDRLGGRPVAVLTACDGDYQQVYDREIEPGTVLKFVRADGEGRFADLATATLWSATGRCLSGRYEGQSLIAVPHYNKIFWYVWADFHAATAIFSPGDQSDSIIAAQNQ